MRAGSVDVNGNTNGFSNVIVYGPDGKIKTPASSGGGVTSVTATSPITSSGGATPVISTSMNTDKLIGRGTAGTGVMEEITLGTGLDLAATTLNVGNIDLSVLSVTSTNAREDNWAPAGWPGTTADVVKVINFTPNYVNKILVLGGLANGSAGKIVTIHNASTDNLIIIEANSTSSLSINTFKFFGRGAYFLFPGEDLTALHNGTQWCQLSGQPNNGHMLFDDFGGPNNTGTTPTQSFFGTAMYGMASGTGSLTRNEANPAGSFGTIGLTTGTTATGYSVLKMNGRSATGVYITSGLYSKYCVLSRFSLNSLPTALQDYKFTVGISSTSNTNGINTSGSLMWYCTSANANWKVYAQNTALGVATDLVSSIPVSTNVTILGTYFPNNLGDCVYFYSTDSITYAVDSMFVRVANVYGGAPVIGIGKSVGTTSVTVDIDYVGISMKGGVL